MLTADLAQSWQRGERIWPHYINPAASDYLQDAVDLIRLFAAHEGQTRKELDCALAEYIGAGTDYKILRGLIKLLMDRCTFETASPIDPVEIRRAAFLKAREHHPVTGKGAAASARNEIIAEVAREIGCAPEGVVQGLYADLTENQELTDFKNLTGGELLDLYNLAQAQALLYRAIEMRLQVEPQDPEGYRELFSAIKAYRLIHTIKGNPQTGYQVRLDGPVSIFHRSQKYGIQMAVFLPALLLCTGWRMRAEIAQKPNRGSLYFEMKSDQDRLRSHYFEATPYENPVLEKLASSWAIFESPWRLEPSREVIDLGESAFIPDFVLYHRDGRRFYLEVLGFWTPRHLQERLREFDHAGIKNFIVAAWDELRGSRDPLPSVPPHVIVFKKNLDPVIVESAINKIISEE
jgi:predicted nuclease of restriction endonuclease-like RecB superfamily